MPDTKETKIAEHIIAIRDAELSQQSNFRNLWQETADWELPMFGRITNMRIPGERIGETLHDITARTDGRAMASGLSSQVIPAGQEFFDLKSQDRSIRDDAEVEEYLSELTEDTHEEMFGTNFIEEFNAALVSLVYFGNSNTFPHWTRKTGLVYRTYPIGTYQVRQNKDGKIDTVIFTVKRTARQLQQQFPKTIGAHVQKALEQTSTQSPQDNMFSIIQIVRPRTDFNPRMVFGMKNKLNMPFQSLYIGELDRNILDEGGFPEFPFAIPRWHRSPGEVEGRGQGTEILPQVRKLNQMEADFTQAGNRWVEPPLEILESFDGTVNLSPRAQNFVVERDSIQAIDLGAKGSYPIAQDALEAQREIIHEAFFKSTFEPLTPLKGDRRTTEEIRGRLNEAFKKLSQPLGRLFSELLTPVIERTVMLLVRNGVVRQPPPQLRKVKIEYTGPAALALRDQHVVAFDNWLDMTARMEELYPGTVDNIDFDESSRDLARFLGVKESHIRDIASRDQIRAERQRQEEAQRRLEAMQIAAQGYGQTTKSPEPGSAAELELQGVA
jgi:hypothetical protein